MNCCGCRLNPSLISEVLPSLAAQCISQSGSVLRRLYLRPQPPTATIFRRDESLIYTPAAGRTGGVPTCLIQSLFFPASSPVLYPFTRSFNGFFFLLLQFFTAGKAVFIDFVYAVAFYY